MKEVKAYALGVPNIAGTVGIPTPRQIKDTKKLLDYVKNLDGFLGIHPTPPRGTALIFKTENDAKRAKNLLIHDIKINSIGNVVECFIPEEYAGGNYD